MAGGWWVVFPHFPSLFIRFLQLVYAGDWRAHVREFVFVYIWSVFVLIFCSRRDDFLTVRDEERLPGRERAVEEPVYVGTGLERRGEEETRGEEQKN